MYSQPNENDGNMSEHTLVDSSEDEQENNIVSSGNKQSDSSGQGHIIGQGSNQLNSHNNESSTNLDLENTFQNQNSSSIIIHNNNSLPLVPNLSLSIPNVLSDSNNAIINVNNMVFCETNIGSSNRGIKNGHGQLHNNPFGLTPGNRHGQGYIPPYLHRYDRETDSGIGGIGIGIGAIVNTTSGTY